MAILLTNGKYYIRCNKHGGVEKTANIKDAQDFYSVELAVRQMNKAPGKCSGYYYTDTESEKSKEEQEQSGNFIITNGQYYIYLNENGKHIKTTEKRYALQYSTVEEAENYMRKAPKKTYKFFVADTDGAIIKNWNEIKGKKKRKNYSKTVRKMIYDKSNGRCMLCGRKILFSDMTLDHIMPLAMGGADDVGNLQTAHLYCNHFKADILPDEFVERITEIFLYQIGKNTVMK